MEEEKVKVIIVVDGLPMLNPELEAEIDESEDFCHDAYTNSEELKKDILEQMIANQVYGGKVGKYTISAVFGHDTVIFDADKFVVNEPDDVVEAFTEINETEEFDLDKFKAENPELYKKYVKLNQSYNVDTKRLEKSLPKVYNRYVTVIPTKKQPTIRIVRAKGDK